MTILRVASGLLLAVWLLGCDTNIHYKAYEDIDDGLWYLNNAPTFRVEITDTTQRYNVYYLVRNGLQYPYYNLYLNRRITGPDSAVLSARLDELFLSDATTGKPYGNGLGDLFDHKIIFLRNYRFPKAGTYTFTFTQSMRQNPLPYILGVGLSVEKVEAATNP